MVEVETYPSLMRSPNCQRNNFTGQNVLITDLYVNTAMTPFDNDDFNPDGTMYENTRLVRDNSVGVGSSKDSGSKLSRSSSTGPIRYANPPGVNLVGTQPMSPCGRAVGVCRPIVQSSKRGSSQDSTQASKEGRNSCRVRTVHSSERRTRREDANSRQPEHVPASMMVVKLPSIASPKSDGKTLSPRPANPLTTSSPTYHVPRVFITSPLTVEAPPASVKETLAQACVNTEDGSNQWTSARLREACFHLEQCTFYFGKITMQEAKQKMSSCETGTYLLRTSSDPLFLFSLSVKTRRGTTSIRIGYKDGIFRLDSDPGLASKLPGFPSVVALVEHYRNLSLNSEKKKNIVFLESTGRKDTPVMLIRPFVDRPSSLSHLTRLAVNATYRSKADQPISALVTSTKIQSYLDQYPFSI